MKMIHSMRLKGPWEYVWLSPVVDNKQTQESRSGSVKIPATWEDCFGKTPGSVVWSRRFQQPTNLDPTERVMIAAPGLAGVTAVRINATELPMDDQPQVGFRFDVTEALQPSNQLHIEMTCSSESEIPNRGMTEPAIIEIWSQLG
jgi:hypothetical protein